MPSAASLVDVAVAVILRADGAFLLARRPAGKVYAGYWEFPGGKIERGESPERALARELHEELGIDVGRAYPWITRIFTYPHAAVRLRFFRVVSWGGDPHPREEQQITWQKMDAAMAEPMLPANAPVLASLSLPHVYALTAASALGADAMLERISEQLHSGLRLIQVREKEMSGLEREKFARRVVDVARPSGARVLINADVALARGCGAHGVHFPARDLSAMGVRPSNFLAGASCHDSAELERAQSLGMDFAVLGPVCPTASHPGAAIMGWKEFERIARGAHLPVYAIGGMTPADLETAWCAGAHGIAMITAAWRQPSSAPPSGGGSSLSGTR